MRRDWGCPSPAAATWALALLLLCAALTLAACGSDGTAASTPSAAPSATAAGTPSGTPTAVETLTSDEEAVYAFIRTNLPKEKKAHERLSKAYRLMAIDVGTHFADHSHYDQGAKIYNPAVHVHNRLADAWTAQNRAGGKVAQLEEDYDLILWVVGDLSRRSSKLLNTIIMKTGTPAATKAEKRFAAMTAKTVKDLDLIIWKLENDLAEIEAYYLVE